ncbi:MAG: hypothetical protein AAGA66_12030 [Bacteroidota bacterium]
MQDSSHLWKKQQGTGVCLDEEDYLLIRELITSCKYQLSKSDHNRPETEDMRKTIEKLDAFFFRLGAIHPTA